MSSEQPSGETQAEFQLPLSSEQPLQDAQPSGKRRRKKKVVRKRVEPEPLSRLAKLTAAAAIVATIAVVGIGVYFITARPTAPRLIGTWQSDADTTIGELNKVRPVSAEHDAALRKVFGKMKVTYTETTLTTELEGAVDTQLYEVVSNRAELTVIQTRVKSSQKDELVKLRFVSNDEYWIDLGQFSECFRRVQ